MDYKSGLYDMCPVLQIVLKLIFVVLTEFYRPYRQIDMFVMSLIKIYLISIHFFIFKKYIFLWTKV